jgi:hypothetical protein
MLKNYLKDAIKFKDKISEDITFLQDAIKFKDKISEDITERINLSGNYGALWEPSENVEKCRGCKAKFQLPLLKRKHHCRTCAGVFCDSCCPLPPGVTSGTFGRVSNRNLTGKESSSGEVSSVASMRVCDGKDIL